MFKVLDKVCVPKRSTKYSAYVDLFSREKVTIGAGETKIVPLGVKIDIEMNAIDYQFNHYPKQKQTLVKESFMKSHYLEVALRSSLAVKGLIIPNGIGIIDLDYPDEIGLIVHNPIIDKNFNEEVGEFGSDRDAFVESEFKINKGDKVCQCTLKEHKGYLIGYESDVIREGGFGSTDKGF